MDTESYLVARSQAKMQLQKILLTLVSFASLAASQDTNLETVQRTFEAANVS